MEYLEFTESIRQYVSEKLGKDKRTEIREVLKNNGVKLLGLMISDPDCQASPTIYLERFYEEYLGGTSVEEIADRIIEIYVENKIKDDILPDFWENYHRIKKNLYLKAVSSKRNSELLEDVPHMDFLDLSLIPYILLKQINQGTASVIIHNAMLNCWKVGPKQILADAMDNMIHHYGYQLTPMEEILKNAAVKELPEVSTHGSGMYVLQSPGMQYSGALMAVDTVMKEVGEQLKSDFIVLPSSIHELIVVPSQVNKSCEKLDELVKCVNETTVSAEEILSDHAYRYKRGFGYVTA